MTLAIDPADVVAQGNLLAAMVVAVAAGFVSFASPCVLPLVPGYLSYMSGLTGAATEAEGAEGAAGDAGATRRTALAAGLFVLGFSLVFVTLGAALGGLTGWLIANRSAVGRVAGVLVIALGLFMTGLVKLPWLYRERRFRMDKVPAGLAGALPLGMVFGLGWTPCIGPTLGAVLGLAAATGGAARGAVLLFAYSLGLGVPFLLAGLGFRFAIGWFAGLRRRVHVFEVAGGVLLVAIGVLLVTGLWDHFLIWLQIRAGGFQTAL